MNSRNTLITIAKFIFVNMIVVFHLDMPLFGSIKLSGSSYIAVQFFFIINGFYLAKSVSKITTDGNAFKEGFLRTAKRIRKDYATVLTAALILLIVDKIASIKDTVVSFILGLLLTQGILDKDHMNIFNGVLWFYSALLITDFFIYILYRACKTRIGAASGIIGLILYIILWMNFSGCGEWGHIIGGFFNTALITSSAGIFTGIFVYWIFTHIKTKEESKLPLIPGFTALIISMLLMNLNSGIYLEIIVIILYAVLIISFNLKDIAGNRTLVFMLDKMTFPIYAFQAIWLRLTLVIPFPNNKVRLVFLVICSIAFAFTFTFIKEKLIKKRA